MMRTTDHPAIQRSVSASDLAHRLTRALAAKDAVGLQALFGSDVDFKGLTPGQLWEARTADALVNDVILGSWFEPTDVIQLIDSVQHSQIGARIRIGYRLYVQNSGGTFIAEQQVFCDLTDGLITWLRILCSGFIAVTEPGAHATADSQDTHVEGSDMTGKAVISLTTGLEDPEKVTVAFLVALGAVESGRPTLMFQAKEAVRLALDGVATGVACEGCPPLRDLLARYQQAGGTYLVCPVCFNAKQLDKGRLLPNAKLAGSVQLWEWIGDQQATTFSY